MRKDKLTDGRNEANSSIPRGNEVASRKSDINPLNAKLNPICHLLALLGAHTILHVSRISVKNGEKKCKELNNRSREIGIRISQKKQI